MTEMCSKQLLCTTFRSACSRHLHYKKNECAYFCFECGKDICQHCVAEHRPKQHSIIQVFRYVYEDVVRVKDIHENRGLCLSLNTTGIQTYTSNSAKVVFLRNRSHNNINQMEPWACVTCTRRLCENCTFCSLLCKTVHTSRLASALCQDQSRLSGSIENSTDAPRGMLRIQIMVVSRGRFHSSFQPMQRKRSGDSSFPSESPGQSEDHCPKIRKQLSPKRSHLQ